MVVVSTVSKIWFFSYYDYFELVHLDLVYYGWIFFALNVVAAISSYYAHAISSKISDLSSIILMLSILTVSILIMSIFVFQWSALLVLFQNLLRGYITPFVEHIMHEHISSCKRATVVSIKYSILALANLILLGAYGQLIKFTTLIFALKILGIFILLCSVLLIKNYIRIFKK